MLKEIVNEKLRKAKEDFLILENRSEYDYYGVLVCLISNENGSDFKHLQIEVAAVKNSYSEEFSESDLTELSDIFIQKEIDLADFKKCMKEMEEEHGFDFTVVIPDIYWWVDGLDEDDVDSETVIEIIDRAIQTVDYAFRDGIGFRISKIIEE